MELPAHIFRVYDIRGLLNEVTPEIARRAGQVLVKMTGAKTVVVGRDMRATSPELAIAAIEGITSMGANVLDIGMCTTPLFSFSVRTQDVQAGLMVTASHNPPEYNGMKFADKQGLPISGQQIYPEMQEEPEVAEVQGSVTQGSVLDEYLNACIDWPSVAGIRGTKIVADYGNGMGAMTMRPLAKKLGIELIELYPEPDARFPNHEANPAKDETLADVKKAIIEHGADFGVAFDGDADRIAFIDNEGQSLRGDLTLVLFAEELLRRQPGEKIVVSPNQSWTTFDTIREFGGELVESAIGRTLVIKKMTAVGSRLSGEVSSHFFFHEFGNLEAPEHAFVRIATLWKASKGTFADLVRPLRHYTNSGEINFALPAKDTALSLLRDTYAPRATMVNVLDGIRCDFDHDWWFIARPSNNEPLLRLIVEASTKNLLEERLSEISTLLGTVGATIITSTYAPHR